MHASRSLAVCTLGLALVAGVSTGARLAGAHAGNNSPTAVHACLHKVTGAARIVPVDGSCHPSEVPAHWGATGPTGPPGGLNAGTIQGQVASPCAASLEGTLVCQEFGFPGGILRCAATCNQFIFSGCIGIPL